MHKNRSIRSELRHNLLRTEISSEKLQANPKIHKEEKTIYRKSIPLYYYVWMLMQCIPVYP